ncbi:MAG: rubrerythrin family protein [Deltaproteobacteria bacterium]|jgi:rubrerythrin|nr:rubrerythrin family protein [Deltaproteobacteria bacterium]
MSSKDPKVIDDLKSAFAGESQANRKYLAYAHKAESEKLPYAAKVFRAAAEAETIHAHSHFRLLGGIKSTKENLQDALDGETYEFTKMYPEMMEDAKAADDKAALLGFTQANEAEKVHAEFFKKAMENPGKDAPKIFVCKVCGHVAEGEPPETCPICGSKRQAYMEIV